ncbi:MULTISPECIES: multicopper oxidase family protein [Ramlibacter]|uniref:Multicopper oxidase domain-containing protein n=1 Tax=Ramlibacter pinisoli TaxID=2682844 RepID=A0A6N8ISD4_9BURK|nr:MULTISPECIES: multicopper oxidase domain-containing protein [Ramlibacter]MBA2964799.1 multicopper oxidase domain-containing protein [Ramlibacter sp. CGMCC 1.13660]MVQ29764.1 multicopper oxidase domain-containing protein [Ramlibacter pinisoli]
MALRIGSRETSAPPGAGPSNRHRRLLLKSGGAAVTAAATVPVMSKGDDDKTRALIVRVPSPPTRPWADELPVLRPLQPVSSLSPMPTGLRGVGECGRADHVAWPANPPVDLYRFEMKVGSHQFHSDLPSAKVWGFNGTYPGSMIHARYGRPILVRLENKLPNEVTGWGSPDISMHLHNMHTPSASDGNPLDWFSSRAYGPGLTSPGEYKDHHYPMVYAGGDSREALGTCWYHDHRLDFTAGNVYRGMAGFFLVYDELDSGNENDPNPLALRLPSGDYDVPLMLSDRQFDSSGYDLFDEFNTDGFIGDKFMVNGKIQPYFHVSPRKYRFRFLNAAISRTYDIQIRYNGVAQGFLQIANDGNLLPAPLGRTSTTLGVAERCDMIVDFSKFPVGAELYLVNRFQQLDGRKPEDTLLASPIPMLKFIVDRPLSSPDYSRVPETLRELPPVNLNEVVTTRDFVFSRDGGAWTVNGKFFNGQPAATPKMGTAEIWTLRNASGGWIHPIHIHFEEGRILSRNGVAPPAHERGRKDVYLLGPNETIRVFLRFRDFSGKYVMHCHNLIHEDHAMMVRYDILP